MPSKNRLSKLDASYLDCRDLSHAWETQRYYLNSKGMIVRELQCVRCETVRNDIFTKGADKQAARYNYAKDYKVEGERVYKHEVHVELFRRYNLKDINNHE